MILPNEITFSTDSVVTTLVLSTGSGIADGAAVGVAIGAGDTETAAFTDAIGMPSSGISTWRV